MKFEQLYNKACVLCTFIYISIFFTEHFILVPTCGGLKGVEEREARVEFPALPASKRLLNSAAELVRVS